MPLQTVAWGLGDVSVSKVLLCKQDNLGSDFYSRPPNANVVEYASDAKAGATKAGGCLGDEPV